MDFQGTIHTDIRDSTPDWTPYRAPSAPTGAPNVLYLLFDDVGIATWDSFGGLVDMPNLRRLVERGTRLSQFHTTALCSPTRAALLTGRNPTSVSVASVVNMAQGFPGHSGRIPAETALIPEVLSQRGWSTYAVGKWHLAPPEDCHPAGSRRYWPLSRGFDRFYGFLDGMTDQWYPSLVSDSAHIDPPATPEQGYHLSKDLADNAIRFLRDHRAAAPDKPWFLYLCPGAGHSPHQAPAEWADRYRGRFDMGYERYREIVLANQKELGLIPADTELSPRNPYADRTAVDGTPWPAGDTVVPWDQLSADEQRISTRMAEVFAGFLSYTDAQIGRVLDFLDSSGQTDNTIVVVMSDNGASGEGGPLGALRDWMPRARSAEATESALAALAEFGGPGTQLNYSTGWAMAFNTPYKMFKRYASHEGGIADPCIVSWPAGLPGRGDVLDAYVHVSDVTPTIYHLLGLPAPDTVRGIPQKPLEGTSFADCLRGGEPSAKSTQFYSMAGTRGIWHDGWFANTVHPPTSFAPRGWSHFDDDRWELYHIAGDRSQIRDLAGTHPAKLAELIALWHEKAVDFQAFPLNDRGAGELVALASGSDTSAVTCYPDTPAWHTPMGGLIRGRSFTMRARVRVEAPDAHGVLYSQGDRAGGQVLFLHGARVHWACVVDGHEQVLIAASACAPGADHDITLRFTRTGAVNGTLTVVGDAELRIDGQPAGSRGAVQMTGLDMLQPVSAGRSVAHPVSRSYALPFALRDAVLDVVTLDIHGSAEPHTAHAVDVGFARD